MAIQQTRVDVLEGEVVLQVSDADMAAAIKCLETNGAIRFRFNEMRIRQFPTDMSFEPHERVVLNGGDGDGGDGDGGDGDGGGGYDVD